jgi:hypothetical protein
MIPETPASPFRPSDSRNRESRPVTAIHLVEPQRHHSRRPRKRSCDSTMCSSNFARSNPTLRLGLLL